MCFSDVVGELQQGGLLDITPSKVRWAIVSGKVTRPSLDGSLNFNFMDENVEELRDYFNGLKNRDKRGVKVKRKKQVMMI
jgi:hypothetical protein